MTNSVHIYGKVACRVHHDTGYRKLSRDTRLVWLTLLTSELAQGGPPGLWRASNTVVLEELAGFSEAELLAAKDELTKAGMLRCDEERRMWWRINSVLAEYNAPDNWQVAVSWARKLASFETCELVESYTQAILEQANRWPPASSKHFVSTLTKCGIRNADSAAICVPSNDSAIRYRDPAIPYQDPPKPPVGAYLDPSCPLRSRLPSEAGEKSTSAKQQDMAFEGKPQDDPNDMQPNRAVWAVFDHWRNLYPEHQSADLSGPRPRLIRIALANRRKVLGCSRKEAVDAVIAALEAAQQDPWCSGHNREGEVKTELSALLATETFERLCRIAAGQHHREPAVASGMKAPETFRERDQARIDEEQKNRWDRMTREEQAAFLAGGGK